VILLQSHRFRFVESEKKMVRKQADQHSPVSPVSSNSRGLAISSGPGAGGVDFPCGGGEWEIFQLVLHADVPRAAVLAGTI
jgi:hypothetical protein